MSNKINGSLLIALNRRFNSLLIVFAIITNRKFKPIKASKLKPSALPSPIFHQPLFTIYIQFKCLILCKSYLNLFI